MHVIIVAMQGVREECLSHGMDGYVSKPIDTEALWRELDKLVNNARETSADKSISDFVVPVVADFEKARQTMDNNQELFDEITRLFFCRSTAANAVHKKCAFKA